MFTDSANACQRSVKKDTTSINGYPSVAQYIKRCLLYTSDAADERSSVDLGGRRIIKKKKIKETCREKNILKKKHNNKNTGNVVRKNRTRKG